MYLEALKMKHSHANTIQECANYLEGFMTK